MDCKKLNQCQQQEILLFLTITVDKKLYNFLSTVFICPLNAEKAIIPYTGNRK